MKKYLRLLYIASIAVQSGVYAADGCTVLASDGARLFALDSVGAPRASLSKNAALDGFARLSPDATKVAYVDEIKNEISIVDINGRLLGSFNLTDEHENPSKYLRDYEITGLAWQGGSVIAVENNTSPLRGLYWSASISGGAAPGQAKLLFQITGTSHCAFLGDGLSIACVDPIERTVDIFNAGGYRNIYQAQVGDEVGPIVAIGNGGGYVAVGLSEKGNTYVAIATVAVSGISVKKWKINMPADSKIGQMGFLDVKKLRIITDDVALLYADIDASENPDASGVSLQSLATDPSAPVEIAVSKAGLGLNVGDTLTLVDSNCQKFSKAIQLKKAMAGVL